MAALVVKDMKDPVQDQGHTPDLQRAVQVHNLADQSNHPEHLCLLRK